MKKSYGFTLIELSIVLTLIALVVGRLLGARAMIHSSELRSALNDEQKYAATFVTFKYQFKALPGDFTEATNIWGQMAPPSTCISYVTTAVPSTVPTPTCNGNGDGQISDYTGNNGNEMLLAWQHLSNAELIPGHYTGTSTTSVQNRTYKPGLNCPSSKIPGGGYSMYYIGDIDNTVPQSWVFGGITAMLYLWEQNPRPLKRISEF